MTTFAYNEDVIIGELTEYIRQTYAQHYARSNSTGGGQIFDRYIDDLDGLIAFCRYNSIKYMDRYGRKDGCNRKDLLKALHYNVLMLSFIDMRDNSKTAEGEQN